jgi:hypothetical protein
MVVARKRQEYTKKKLNKTRKQKEEQRKKELEFYEALEKKMNDKRVDDMMKGTRNG